MERAVSHIERPRVSSNDCVQAARYACDQSLRTGYFQCSKTLGRVDHMYVEAERRTFGRLLRREVPWQVRIDCHGPNEATIAPDKGQG